MSNNLQQYKPQERGYNDITPVQAPVIDESVGGVERAAAEAISTLGGYAVQAHSIWSDNKAADEKEALLKQKEALSNRYVEGLKMLSMGMSQDGRFAGLKAKDFQQKLESDLLTQGLSAEEMLDLQIKFGKVPLGKQLSEGTEYQQMVREEKDKAFNAGLIHSGMTEEETQAGITLFRKHQADIASANYNIKMIDEKLKREDLSKAELTKLKEDRKAASMQTIKLLASQEADKAPVFLSGLQGKPAEEAIALLDQKIFQINQTVGQMGAGGDLAQIDALAAPLLNYYKTVKDNFKLGPVEKANRDKAAVDSLKATNESKMYKEDPTVLAGSILTSVYRDNPLLRAKLVEASASSINKWLKIDTPAPDPLAGDSDSKAMLEVTVDAVGQLKSGKSTATPEEVEALVSNVLEGTDKYLREGSKSSEYADVVKFFANPSIVEYMKANPNMSKEQAANIGAIFQKTLKRDVVPVIRETIKDNTSTRQLGSKVGEEAFELTISNGNPVFKIADGVSFGNRTEEMFAMSTVQELNKKAGSILKPFLVATEALTGESMESLASTAMPLFFSDGRGSEQQAEQQPQQVDYSQYEGREGVDEKGNRFVIRNGIPVKIRSGDGD